MSKLRYSLAFLMCVVPGLTVFAKTVEVAMLNNSKEGVMVFEPPVVQIALGDSVLFVPKQPGGHNSESVAGPKGGPEWKSGYDQELRVTFDVPGVYFYKCSPHLALGMIGFVVVENANNFNAITSQVKKTAQMIYTNKERVDIYLKNIKD